MDYAYDALPGPRSFRLLALQPAAYYEDPIECTIITEDLDSTEHEYDALSYSWSMDSDGNPGQNHPLKLNGSPFSVTQSLFDGLRRIRTCNRPVSIWIDAICINQSDNVEKSSQVAIMAVIYAGAKSAIVWLGEGGDATEDELFLQNLKRVPHASCFYIPLLGKAVSNCPGCAAFDESGHKHAYRSAGWETLHGKGFQRGFEL